MIERVHEHLLDELKTNTRTDTIFIITAIILNLVAASINAAVASESDELSSTLIFVIFSILIVVINTVVFFGLAKGKHTRQKLLNGLIKLYEDQKVSGYYDEDILGTYNFRYLLFTIVVISTGVAALAIPIIIKIIGI